MAAPLLLVLLLFVCGAVGDDVPPITFPPGFATGKLPPEARPFMEGLALRKFVESLGNADALNVSWVVGGSPCDAKPPWDGVVCVGGTVAGIRIAGLNLSGHPDFFALSHLKYLRSVSLASNSFSGPLSANGLSRMTGLKALYLSNNQFEGEIPGDIFPNMKHLKKLFLDGNKFTGAIPSDLSHATGLIELHLENNRFSGQIPDLGGLKSLKYVNVSNNQLVGPVPDSLAHFNATSFGGNSGLCGPQFNNQCTKNAVTASGGSSSQSVMVWVVGIMLACALAAGALAAVRKRQRDRAFDTLGRDPLQPHGPDDGVGAGSNHWRGGSAREVPVANNPGGGNQGNGGELVMINMEKGAFGLPDLMKAAAEVLGTGGMGSAYKAVMANGVAVAVKRMRDVNRVGREAFEEEMRRLGRLRHPNILTPLAYHYRKDEKLLISEFVPKGSLLYILHGNRGAEHVALDWSTRLRIARGIARGLAYLHAELSSHDVPHGNLKSGNILLSSDHEPLLVDYGLMPLVNPSLAAHALFAYKSPEAVTARRLSPKSDVFCLGIVILEIISGKFPSHYLNNTKGGTDLVRWAAAALAEDCEGDLLDPAILNPSSQPAMPDLRRLVRHAALCADPEPESRPNARDAAAAIDEIAAAAFRAAGDGGDNKVATVTASENVGTHASYVRLGSVGDRSARRLNSTGDRSARRSDDGIAFGIS